MVKRRGLGKGLGAFFGEEVIQEVEKEHEEARRDIDGAESHHANHQTAEQEKDGSKRAVQKTAAQKEAGKRTAAAGRTAGTAAKTTAKEPAKTAGKAAKTVEKSEKVEKTEKTEKTVQQEPVKEAEPREITLKLSQIEPNREQPRKEFNEEQMQELADSIRQYGVLQPLLVQKMDGYYEIIAGERRWRAAKMVGLKEIPVVIREYSKQQTVEIALIENVQREDLNPIEEALAYQRLMQEFQLKQEEIAARVSKNRTTITNSMRLLNLCPEVQQMLIGGQISSGHARALLGVEDPEAQLQLAQKIEKERLSVREVEKLVKQLAKGPRQKKEKPEDEALELIFRDLEERMKTVMGTKVNISRKDKSKGRIEIEYYSESELERIVELIESIR